MKAFSRIIAVGSFLGLAGCGLPGTFLAEPFINADIAGSGFNQILARAYQNEARIEGYDEVSWTHAGSLATKGYMAGFEDQTVLPYDPAEFGLTDPELVSLRNELLAALDNGGRQQRPEECAMAQATYDHYIRDLADGGYQHPTPPEIKDEFVAWLEKCRGVAAPPPPAAPPPVAAPPAAPNVFTIYFGFDRTDLTAEARNAISSIIGALSSYTNPTVQIFGHTDTAGSNAYNQGLSDRRANVVADALSAQGVSRGAMSLQGFGENDLAAPTPDGTPEPLNRRAVVVINP